MDLGTVDGWSASFARVPRSALGLLTLSQGSYSQNVRLDLDKGIAIDAVMGVDRARISHIVDLIIGQLASAHA